MPIFEEGLKSANALTSLVEKIYDRIINIEDRRKRRKEIARLHDLLERVRIGRRLNIGLVAYATSAADAFEDGHNKDAFLQLIDQIQNSLMQLIEIVDKMAEEKDRVVLYESEGYQELTLVAHGRHNLLQELRELRNSNDGDGLKQAIGRYEQLSLKLGSLSFKLAQHGRDLDRSLS